MRYAMLNHIPMGFSRLLPLTLALTLAMGCFDSGEPIPQPSPKASPSATATETPVPSPVPTPIPTPRPSPTPSATATVPPTPTEVPPLLPWELDRTIPPDRDLYALAQRLLVKTGDPIPRVVNTTPVSYAEGREDDFYVTNIMARQVYTVTATLTVVSEHAYWYVDNRVSLPIKELREAARIFEEEVYPNITEVFGTEWTPGVDNDTHLTILPLPATAESPDTTPPRMNTRSRCTSSAIRREMIYISTTGSSIGSSGYMGTLAHELTHAVQWRADPTEDTWINEGLAEIGRELAGYPPLFQGSFLASPSISLTLWPNRPSATIPHYGGANLFFDYLADHYGGYQGLRLLQDQQANGVHGIQAYLKEIEAGKTFQEVFANWVVANYLDEPGRGIYSYSDREVRVAVSDVVQEPRDHQIASSPVWGPLHRPAAGPAKDRYHLPGTTEHPSPLPGPSQRKPLLVGQQGRQHRHNLDQSFPASRHR